MPDQSLSHQRRTTSELQTSVQHMACNCPLTSAGAPRHRTAIWYHLHSSGLGLCTWHKLQTGFLPSRHRKATSPCISAAPRLPNLQRLPFPIAHHLTTHGKQPDKSHVTGVRRQFHSPQLSGPEVTLLISSLALPATLLHAAAEFLTLSYWHVLADPQTLETSVSSV